MKRLGLMCAAILSLVSCSTAKPETSTLTSSNSSSNSSEIISSSSSSENKSYFSVDIPTIAHRGYHTTEIENTEGAFLAAAQRNFVGIETDIYWTKDGYIICNHDTSVNYYGKLTPIKDLTYQEIIKFSKVIENASLKHDTISFIIGGSHGLCEKLKKLASLTYQLLKKATHIIR